MVYLAGLGLSIILIAIGIRQRRWRGLPVDSGYASKLVWVPLGLGGALGSLAFPATWLVVSFSIHGGRIEDNLPPGTDPKVLLGLFVVGTFFSILHTLFGYRDHVFPYRIGGDGLDRTPEDRPEEQSGSPVASSTS